MGEKIFDLLKSLATGNKSKKFWGALIVIFIIVLIVFPYLDANFFYYNRIEKRIDNLTSIVELNDDKIHKNQGLLLEYESIIREINDANQKSLNTFNNSTDNEFEFWAKAISGGLLSAIVGIIGLFKKNNTKMTFSVFFKNNFLIFIVCSLFAVILSFIFSKIPTLGNVWVNVIAAPIVELIIIYLFTKSNNKKDEVK